MNQKGFANIALIVLVVVLTGVVGYFAFVKKSEPVAQQQPTPTQTKNTTITPKQNASPTPTPTQDKTANWKTYTNTSLGFSIKYPSDWKIDALRSDRTKSGSDVVFDIGIPESHEGIRVDTSNQTLAEWRSSLDNSVIEQTLNLTIDGQPAISVDTTEFARKLVAVKSNGKLYIFTTGGRMIDNGMLATVKFIK